MKILQFNDIINNTPKFERELSEEFPTIFDSTWKFDGKFYVKFSVDLNQDQINTVNSMLNNFVEQSALDELVSELKSETEQGFDLYRQLVADINLQGGLNPSLDESIRLYCGKAEVSTMVISLEDVRCLLKDNFVEFSLRALNHFLDPAIGFNNEQLERYSLWVSNAIRKRMKAQGIDDMVIEGTIQAIMTAPKGAI